MSATDNLSLNANKVVFSSSFSTQQILASDDTGTFTISLAANTTLVTSPPILHGQTIQPLCIGLFSIDNANWYGLGANIFISGQTDVISCSAYTTTTSVIFGAVNYGSAPTAKTVRIKYWLITV